MTMYNCGMDMSQERICCDTPRSHRGLAILHSIPTNQIKPKSKRQNVSSSLTSDAYLGTSFTATTTSIVHRFPFYSVRSDGIMLARSVLRSVRAVGNARSVTGRTATVVHPVHRFVATDKLTSFQRSTATSSRNAASEAATSPLHLTVAGTVTTAVAIGSMAWYYHVYGPTLYAMTPQEEGYWRQSKRFKAHC